jgi:hypothetical protein
VAEIVSLLYWTDRPIGVLRAVEAVCRFVIARRAEYHSYDLSAFYLSSFLRSVYLDRIREPRIHDRLSELSSFYTHM